MQKIDAAHTDPQKRKRKVVHLNTHSVDPIRSEEDVDRYLESLKQQLMRYINDGDNIIIS